MKDNIDSASAVENIILCESNFQPQSPSHKFCRLLQVLAAVQKLLLQNYLTEQQSVGGGRVLLRWGRGVSMGVICVMTVQSLSYPDKWTCLHPTRRAEDMAPSRRMAFIFPHVASHLPNRSSAGCQDWCWGGFHLHPGRGSITPLFGNQSFLGSEVELDDCWRYARVFSRSGAQMIFNGGSAGSQLAPSCDGTAKLLALKCCFWWLRILSAAPLVSTACALTCTCSAAWSSLAVQADLTWL